MKGPVAMKGPTTLRPRLARVLGAMACAAMACATLACSSSSGGGGSFAQQFCSKLSSCNVSVMNCEASASAIVLSSSCQSTVLSASCTDLTTSPVPASLASCFPPCTNTGAQTCNGDGTITVCNSGNAYKYECTGVCSTESKSYTGTCSATYMGQTAPNGQTCWCQ
jgi:hypothetical protein